MPPSYPPSTRPVRRLQHSRGDSDASNGEPHESYEWRAPNPAPYTFTAPPLSRNSRLRTRTQRRSSATSGAAPLAQTNNVEPSSNGRPPSTSDDEERPTKVRRSIRARSQQVDQQQAIAPDISFISTRRRTTQAQAAEQAESSDDNITVARPAARRTTSSDTPKEATPSMEAESSDDNIAVAPRTTRLSGRQRAQPSKDDEVE